MFYIGLKYVLDDNYEKVHVALDDNYEKVHVVLDVIMSNKI